jgi:hypothetical protein
MKIKVPEEKIIRAIKRFEGIDIVLGNIEDARQAINLILRRTDISKHEAYKGLKEIKISSVIEHATTAMEHQTNYIIEFVLENDSFIDMEIALIRELQKIFG